MKILKNTKMNGFTLPELVVVLVIVGILATLSTREFSGYIEKSEATQVSSTITSIDSEINALSKTHRLGNCASNNRLVLSGNNMLDVLYGGDSFVSADMKVAFQNEPKALLAKGLTLLSTATAGTAGTYAVGKYPVTIEPCTTSENIYMLSKVPTGVLISILFNDYKNLSDNFNASSALTSGPIQYTAADSNAEHQVKFYMKR